MAKEIRLGIRTLAEFILCSGSIDSKFSGLNRAIEGGRIHRILQRQGGAGYEAEVPLAITLENGGFTYVLSGRADGVITRPEGIIVDEIKTTVQPLEQIAEGDNPAHWAQGCCYGHILCSQRKLDKLTVQLTYCHADTMEVQRFSREYTAGELAEAVASLLTAYHRWAELSDSWAAKRDASLRGLAFPFEGYRSGQRNLAVACYNTIQNSGRLFCCAPTGTGKTISTIFPAMKAMGEGYGERIFYLTAKTVTRKAAEETLALLRKKAEEKNEPLCFHSLTLTAKDKICFLEERDCRPEVCQWARGYYDKINDAMYEILQEASTLGRDELEAYARRYDICPYELSLDLALWCDCIVCDYNYLFDPVVHLQRFFEGKGGDNIFLIDEAHNLVDRSREMYSATLCKEDFYSFKKQLPKHHKKLHKALGELNSGFVALRRRCEETTEGVFTQAALPEELEKPRQKFTQAAEEFLEKNRGSEFETDLLALYFSVLFYDKIAEQYGENYVAMVHGRGGHVEVRLLCLDPSGFLNESLEKGRASIFFSATLQPLPYYREVLGGGEEAKFLVLESPFTPDNLGLFIADGISTKYAHRSHSLPTVAAMLANMAAGRQGNYIAFFPSYSYMQQVVSVFEEEYPHIPILVQTGGMDEQAREDFLCAFKKSPANTLLGFCVMGGIFAEGVDLAGDRLIGAAIVGVGLPQIGPEPNELRRYYDEKNDSGFEFAYQFPGMNKVMQAAGRVIRSEQDRGIVLLIDSRFTSGRYRAMFPAHWAHWQRVTAEALPAALEEFWNK